MGGGIARLVIVAAILGAPGAASADEVAPDTTHRLDPPGNARGWHRAPVAVRLAAADTGGSGVRETHYRVGDGPWAALPAGAPIRIATQGTTVVQYRSTDAAGNVEPARTALVRIDRAAPGLALSGVRRGRRRARVSVTAHDALAGAVRLVARTERGRRVRQLERTLFGGAHPTLDGWRHDGSGSFEVTPDGTLRTVGGLGLLWYTQREFGDAAFRLQWREGRPDGQLSNGGVFVRFPGPSVGECDARLPLALADFSWHAVACGHEIQINDGDADPQQTGSVYAFAPLDPRGARPTPFGAWNDYEVRVAGGGSYEVTVVRNGHVINHFLNTPGQSPATGAEPEHAFPRALYPPTDVKQFSTGHFGLQNHGDADTIEYRDVRALPLGERRAAMRFRRRASARTVRLRAIDAAGRRSRPVEVRIPRRRG